MPQGTLSILDVGHGNCAVLHDSEGVVVVDTGPGSALLEFLAHEGIFRLNVVLISHADEDHIRGVIALLSAKTVRIDTIRVNTDSLKESVIWDDLLWELQRANNAGKLKLEASLTTIDTGKFDIGRVHIEILAPSQYLALKGPGSNDRKGRSITTNSISAVIRLLSQDGKPIALFPGDIDEIGLENLIELNVSCDAPLVVFPHHGGRPGTGDVSDFAKRFCALTQPQILVFSIGRGQFKTPRPEIISTARKQDPNIRIVCTQLSEHCAFNTPLIEPAHLSDAFSRGREKHTCCAGTIVVDTISPFASLSPDGEAHLTFIGEHAPTALCLRV